MSSLSHSFCVEHAESYGIECAILINHFQFWIGQNRAMGRNNYDGRTWMYQTQKEIASIYPYWSEDVVYKIIKKLVDLNILIKGNYNKTPFDKTIWYAFQNEKMFTKPSNDGISSNERRNPKRPVTEPIPDTKQDTKQIKQQQASPVSAAAVSFDSSKKEQQKPKIWPILENIQIPIEDKIEITRNYSEKVVIYAVMWATHPLTVINKTLAAAIKWACKHNPTMPQQKADIEQANKEYAKKYDGIEFNGSKVEVLSKHVEICRTGKSYSGSCYSFTLPYNVKGFIEQFISALRKNNFKILETA